MKNIGKSFAALFLGAALLTACNKDDGITAQQTPAIDVTTRTLQPNATGSTGESGSVRAFVGEIVTAQGINLDCVSRVTFAAASVEGAEEVEAEIVEKSLRELKFKVPSLGLAQRDAAYAADLRVYGDKDHAVFHYVYYVTVPVTDAFVSGYSPASGTVGTVIKIEGRNLEQISEVHFADRTIRSDEFVEVIAGPESSSVSFAVPAGTYAAGESDASISVVWGDGNTIDVSGDTPFKVRIPNAAPIEQPEGATAKIGDELTITGPFLDLVTAVKWGAYDLILMTKTAESITVKFPSSIEAADPVVAVADIIAVYGEPAQSMVLVAAYRVDTTPRGPAAPVYKSFAAEDGGADKRLYLGKRVTVTGENLASVEKFLVNGVEASLAGTPTDVQAEFIVPDGVDFSEAKEVAIEAVYDGGNKMEMFSATVYPFYYWPNITIGAQGASNRAIAFFVPNWGKVISTDEWAAMDKYASLTVMSDKNTLNKTEVTSDQYYEVPGYFFCTGGSSFSLLGPCGSDSQLSKFTTSAGAKIIEKGYGTPIFGMRNLSAGTSAEEQETVAAVKDGSIRTMIFTKSKVASSTPKYDGQGSASNTFANDQVLLIQHVTYGKGTLNPAKEEVHRGGFIHIKKIENETTNDATMTFDCYWSKTLNE